MSIKLEEKIDQFKISFDKSNFVEDLKFPHPIQKAVMPIIRKAGDEVIPLGTAFNITSNGFMLTARHVIEDIFDEYIKESKRQIEFRNRFC